MKRIGACSAADAWNECFRDFDLMVWKGASTKTLLEVLVLELGLTAQCTVGARAQHTVAHLLTVTHRRLQWRSHLRLLRSITDEERAKWQLMPRSRTRLPEPRTASLAQSRRTSLRFVLERVNEVPLDRMAQSMFPRPYGRRICIWD